MKEKSAAVSSGGSLRRRRFRKAVASLLVFLLLFSALALGLTGLSLRLLFGRRDSIPPTELRYEEYSALPREEISFSSGKNTLRGWLYADPEASRGLILVVHGVGGGADSHLPEIERFAAEGYAVLAYDGTGTRRSDGDGVRGLAQARFDLEAALDYVQGDARLRELPLLLYGHSAGAYAAATVLPEHPEVAGAVCLAAFDRPSEEMLVQARLRTGFPADLGGPLLRLCLRLQFGKDADASAAEAISRTDVPVLIAAGTNDTVVPLPASLIARRGEIENPAVEVLFLPGGHSDFWFSREARSLRIRVQEGEALDLRACSELNEELMDRILDLYSAAVETAPDAA